MGICGHEYSKEEYLNKREQKTKCEITKIEADIECLETEVNSLNQQINGNNGGKNGSTDNGINYEKMSIKKKNEENKKLLKKIKKLNKLKLIRNKLMSNLEKMEDLKLHKKYNGEIKENNKLFANNKMNGKEIGKNNILIKKLNDESEEVYREYKDGEEMLDDGMNEYEIDQEIKEYFKSEK